MKKYVCPDCGKSFEEGQVPASCPNCGCPSSAFQEQQEPTLNNNISPALESSNDFGSEHMANGLAEVIKTVCIIIGVVGGISAITLFCIAAGEEYGQGFFVMIGALCLVIGLLILLMGLISSAFIKLFVNMSYRLTRLDNKYNPS